MDPLHPIIPVPLNIPPVQPPPSVGRISRDQRERARPGPQDEDDDGGDERDQERPDEGPARRSRGYEDDLDGETGGGSHIDVTA